ncbi:MAG: peptide chain release factor N(5)-glutamine methyltransferase [Terracidiphilus sp.]|nr:peptide chain release factor N(5)-glutamine methyltransferase [Terracidiphilus sp.]
MRKAEVRLAKGPHAERARRDAETLMMHLIQRDKAYLMAHPEQDLSAEGAVRYYAQVDRRLAGEPIQYITGEQEFYGLPFCVNHHVLIPRPETEGLVERVLELAAGFKYPRIVDVGTGSGAIVVTLASKLPQAEFTAIDISSEALDVANSNAARNGVASRIRFQQGDLLTPVKAGGVEIVVSNPPYVATTDREAMAVEVREFEPTMALFAGVDGLDVYRRLIPAAQEKLAPGGWLAMEIGCGQAEAIADLLAAAGFAQIEFARDLAGIERVATARRLSD